MIRFLQMALLALVLSACSSNGTPPRNTENACAMLSERPDYARAIRAAERKWGIPAHLQLATIYQESSFVGNARPPRKYFLGFIPRGRVSSAYGYAQAIDGTWGDYVAQEGGMTSRRTHIRDATDFMGWYMAGTSRQLGVARHDAMNQYLAYHEGRRGYSRGSYNSKPWLIAVARRVEARSERYRTQMSTCRW